MKIFLVLFSLFFMPQSVISAATPPPPADDVFLLSTKIIDPNTIAIEWQVKPGFFLYSNRIKVTAVADNNFRLGNVRLPKSIRFTDKQKKKFWVYRENLTVPVAILGEQPGEGFLNLSYQGCADDGFCYPPQSNQLKIAINTKLEVSDVSIEESTIATPTSSLLTEGGEKLEQLFTSKNWTLIFLSFLGFGVLLTFTPCVLPMIPVLSSIIVGQGKKISTNKAFFLSLSYVLSMATTYALFGALIALAGSNLQLAMQTPWAIGLFSFIFILLSLSMFGFYELRLPAGLQEKLTAYSHKQATGQYVGAAIMGCLSTLILSPCVTAPLIGALSYIASSGDIIRGGLALFFLGLGMGIPLLIIGTSAGKLLPKAGSWMESIKALFGVLLISVAIYLLTRILPGALIMAMWGSLLIFCGIFVGAFNVTTTHIDKIRKGSGIILLAYGLLIFIGTSQGHINPVLPLASDMHYLPVDTGLPTKKLTTLKQVKQVLSDAKGSPVIIDFYADWCSSCQHIEATTLKDPKVIAALRDFVFIKVDVTQNNADSKALLGYFNVVAPPTFIFYDKNGIELNNLRLVGDITPDMFLKKSNRALV